jgi:CheY-like chemotaxis protein
MSPRGIAGKSVGAARARIDAILTKPARHNAVITCLARLLFPSEALAIAEPASFVADEDAEARLKNTCRILLAEDNVINQQVAAGILKRAGYIVDVVDDGIAAVDAAESARYGLILMDIQMPRMGGAEATNFIRKITGYRHTPIIAMTAHAMRGTREECLQAGMNDYVTKPFGPRDFLSVVRRWSSHAASRSTAKALQVAKAPTEPPILDVNHVAALKASMDQSDFDELIAGVPLRLQDRLNRLESAFRLGDFEALEHEAHTLISGAGNVGAKALSNLALEVEAGAAEKDHAKCATLMQAIGKNASMTLAALRAQGAPVA